MVEFFLGLVIGMVARDYLPKLLSGNSSTTRSRGGKPNPPAFAVVQAALRGNQTARAFVQFVEARAQQGDAEARRYLTELTAAFAYAKARMPPPEPQSFSSAQPAPEPVQHPIDDVPGNAAPQPPMDTAATTATAAEG